jgi:hypothetical protein
MMRHDLHEATCRYRDELGWCIIPIGKEKKPVVGWGMYKTFKPRPEEHKDWFRHKGVTGIAVLNGSISGGLVCRDFDQEASYQDWAARHPKAAGNYLTVRTRRGYHVYFRCPEISRTYKLDDGELRGSGINILPPSVHPSGIHYKWVVGPHQIDRIRTVEKEVVRKLGWMRSKPQDNNAAHRTERTENTEETEITEKTEEITIVDAELEGLIRRCLPTAEGERHRQVFELARELKPLPRFREFNPRSFEQVLHRWHELALPVITTKPFEESWFAFLRGWPLIKYLKDDLSVERIADRARGLEVPEAAKYEQPKLRELVAICRELQNEQGDAPFFLSCRTAGKLLDISYHEANLWLSGLVLNGTLKVTEKGVPGGKRATRYRFVAQKKV